MTGLDPIPADLIQHLSTSLKLITNYGVGTDKIDLAAAQQRHMQVGNTPVVSETLQIWLSS